MIQKYKITIEYFGNRYCGSQKQQSRKTIQGAIENSLEHIFNQKIATVFCGRTDSGVHALGQVAHFDIDISQKKLENWQILNGINAILDQNNEDISIIYIEKVDQNFHARFDCKSRTYLYKIFNCKEKSQIYKKQMLHIPYYLDIMKMQEAGNILIGKHNFNAFRSSSCQANSSIRNIFDIKVTKINENIIEILFHGDAFLHNMIRIMVGTLINVGQNKITLDQLQKILNSKDRKLAGKTVEPHGLYFIKAEY